MSKRRGERLRQERPHTPSSSYSSIDPAHQPSPGSQESWSATEDNAGHQFFELPVVPRVVQAKFAVSEPTDASELEADRAADQLLQAPASHVGESGSTAIQKEPDLRRAPAAAATRPGGVPLDPQTRSFMEPRFGYDFSHVRVHPDSMAAPSLDARAFTVGSDIDFAPNEYAPGSRTGQWLIAHELAHVVQDAGSDTIHRKPNPYPRERVVDRRNVAERSRTVAKIEIIGHASPRWRSAPTPQIADAKNWELAEQRAEMARMEVETLLSQLLPNRDLVFDYQFKRASKMERSEPVEALTEPADVTLDVEGRGSTDTLGEAGTRGRKANDDPMRRVEVQVTLYSETETDVAEDIERTEQKPGATTDWSIWVTGEAGVEAVGKVSAILVQLKNEKTGAVGTYAGWTGGVGASVGINIAKTSLPDFESFTTPEPMTFADFSGANFSISSIGFGLGAFGAEWSKFQFDKFPGRQKTPGGIQVGGLQFGGFELNLGSVVYGAMFLTDNPSETFLETTKSTRMQQFESFDQEKSAHRMHFDTGSAAVGAWESDLLNEYLYGIVTRSGL